jgi:CheY-like chemotaxis protein
MSESQRLQILLVEDDPDDVVLMTEVLGETGIPSDLQVASDGEEAMDVFYRRRGFADAPVPDLVLLDLNLPKKDGRQVLREIKAHPTLCRIPVIVLTTSAHEQDVLDAYLQHANAYVRKPVGYAALLEVIGSIQRFWAGTAVVPPRAAHSLPDVHAALTIELGRDFEGTDAATWSLVDSGRR